MRFSKMHGTGNDFIVVDGRGVSADWGVLARRLCDRHFGVGADGLLVATVGSEAPLMMRMFNPDGSEAEMCGNGIRCFAKYAVEQGLVPPSSRLLVQTLAGVKELALELSPRGVERVRVEMGLPRFLPEEIPLDLQRLPEGMRATQLPLVDVPLEVAGHSLSVTCLSMGNPHAVAFLESDPALFPLETIGPLVERYPLFPRRVNFEIARPLGLSAIEAKVWERGAGLTLACGTGACAVAVAARLRGMVGDQVEVRLPGGPLEISWDGEGPVYLSGPAELVFTGEWQGPL